MAKNDIKYLIIEIPFTMYKTAKELNIVETIRRKTTIVFLMKRWLELLYIIKSQIVNLTLSYTL